MAKTSSPLASGPFPGGLVLAGYEIVSEVDAGATGRVFRAVHGDRGDTAAVKVLTAFAPSPEQRASFQDEVVAMARLDHPHVAAILGHGVLPAGVETHGFTPGVPYLITEWASGGTLATWPIERWDDLRSVLRALLDGLAHAHARGVVHRDLKPANVLVCTEHDVRPGPKLADFGIARLRDPSTSGPESVSGTVPYMAPEQVRGASRLEGPWTDLYALGCVLYRLATGRPPFHGLPEASLMLAHLAAPPPPLLARFAVPAGLERWARQLLAKDPHARFRHAADARAALDALGPAVVAPMPELSSEVVDHDSATVDLSMPDEDVVASQAGAAQPPAVAVVPFAGPLPPWDTRRARSPALRRSEAVTLVGLRALPTVARDEVRETLWRALGEARETGSVRVVCLEGAQGTGKTHLARWLATEADESGFASVLDASHGPEPGPLDGVRGMLARALRCAGLTEADARAHVASAVLDPEHRGDADALVALALGTSTVRFRSPRERYAAVRRHLARLARQRALVWVLDDAHFGADALELLLAVLDAGDRFPMVVVCSFRPEVLAGRSVEHDLVVRLQASSTTTTLEVGPLPAAHWPELVREVLGLDDDVALEVEERAAGNPSLALEIVRRGITANTLVAGRRGWKLAPGATLEAPEDMLAGWANAVESALGKDSGDSRGVEVAALLGRQVSLREWTSVCGILGIEPPWTLLEGLRAAALVDVGRLQGQLAFAHELVREALERRARAHGREAALHLACAEMLRAAGSAEHARRIGSHTLAAGRPEEALAPLLEAAADLFAQEDLREAARVLGTREEAMAEAGVPPGARARIEGDCLLAAVETGRGRNEEAESLACRAEAAARACGDDALVARAMLLRARIATHRGHLEEAEDLALEASTRAATTGGRDHGHALLQLAMTRLERGRVEACEEALALANEVVEGHDAMAALATYQLGVARGRRGDPSARELFMRARDWYRALGMRSSEGHATVMLGEFARNAGDPVEAQEWYLAAIALYESVGSGNAAIARANLALALRASGAWMEARQVFEVALHELRRNNWRAVVACIEVELSVCEAMAHAWARWDALMTDAVPALAECGIISPDLARAAEVSGDHAAAAGEHDRAGRAWTLAEEQWTKLGENDRAAGVAQKRQAAPPDGDHQGRGDVREASQDPVSSKQPPEGSGETTR